MNLHKVFVTEQDDSIFKSETSILTGRDSAQRVRNKI